MPRGWRNDPRWVQIYEQRRFQRENRELQREFRDAQGDVNAKFRALLNGDWDTVAAMTAPPKH